MQAPTEHDLKLIGETTEKIRDILDKAPAQLIVGFIRIQNELNFQLIDGNNVSTNFSLEDGKLAIESINHHPFAQQTEDLKEGFKVARWSYDPTENAITFWRTA